ncbi:HAD-IA family hydrolase [Actinoplanes bogorensis]|uniref:HAD-IA family hydrolase n=1 Tax=Paractinoplanes bogorensis TaxID=1610840 RepID=A0ABS5Z3N5_9ACTN|nr:HAD-IA family hydrolase [Actinoplanes bogorensis]MBU2670301.1 HAD-IA family hydrolase [Actinoplanes bogorensis]
MMWRSPTDCQPPDRLTVVVSGVAGSGKSTLGRALATALAAPLLDLDSLTNPLLDALPPDALGGHWLASPHAALIRDGRYAALRAAAHDVIATAGRAVLVAPFTAELRGGPEWTALSAAAGAVTVIHLEGTDDLFATRRAIRTEPRDRHRVPEPLEPPAVPVIRIDAELTTEQQLLRALVALGLRRPLVFTRFDSAGVPHATGNNDLGTSGATGDIDLGVSGATDDIDPGASGATNLRATGDIHPGATGDIDPGASGASGATNLGATGDIDVGAGGATNLGATGDIDPGAAGDIDLGAAGDIDLGASGATGDTTGVLLGRDFDAVLFDLDGTLADSTASVLRSWRRFADEMGVSAQAVAENHGRPARALLEKLLPYDRTEEGLARVTDLEMTDAATVRPALGAADFYGAVPAARRAIVTSGTRPLATARLRAAGLPLPDVMVTADDVRHGKPDPEPFLLAAERLGVDPRRCLAVEDAPAGIRSARAAGCTVLAVTGTSPADELKEADLITDGLDRLSITTADGRIHLTPGRP